MHAVVDKLGFKQSILGGTLDFANQAWRRRLSGQTKFCSMHLMLRTSRPTAEGSGDAIDLVSLLQNGMDSIFIGLRLERELNRSSTVRRSLNLMKYAEI